MLFYYYACILVKLVFVRNWLKPGRDYIIYQRAENVFSPQSSAPFVFYLREAVKGLILQCLYHLKVAAKPAAGFGQLSPRPSLHLFRLACEDLLLWWRRGSMWGEDVLSQRAGLISRLSSRGSAEGQPHNRMIHHVGLAHLSHVTFSQRRRWTGQNHTELNFI